jgi:hypothetical protein
LTWLCHCTQVDRMIDDWIETQIDEEEPNK